MKQTERNLSSLLADIQPILRPETYVFCTIPVSDRIPGAISPMLTFREQEGTTLSSHLPKPKLRPSAINSSVG